MAIRLMSQILFEWLEKKTWDTAVFFPEMETIHIKCCRQLFEKLSKVTFCRCNAHEEKEEKLNKTDLSDCVFAVFDNVGLYLWSKPLTVAMKTMKNEKSQTDYMKFFKLENLRGPLPTKLVSC